MREIYIIFLVLFSNLSFSQISLNNRAIKPATDTSEIQFLVTAHIYGKGSNQSGLPASTFLSFIDSINRIEPYFLINLGDLFQNVRTDIPIARSILFPKIKIPILNAVGDHDISGTVYQEAFGETYYKFALGKNLFIILDTELNDSYIKDEQLSFLTTLLTDSTTSFNNIFLFSHRPIWAEESDTIQGVFKYNTNGTFGTNYKNEIYPLLKSATKSSEVYWFSGSTGAATAPYFYHQPESRLHFIQATLKNITSDGLISVTIEKNKVLLKPISLLGEKHLPIEEYNLAYWKENSGLNKPLTIRQRLTRFYTMITDYRFIYGLFSAGAFFLLVGLIKKQL